jgi:hypothetical protein
LYVRLNQHLLTSKLIVYIKLTSCIFAVKIKL